MIEEILYQLQDPNTQWVLIGTLLLGMASGVLGSFSLLRKQSLIGDAMAHAALPGVCLAYMIYGQKSLLWFLVGAAIAGLLAAWLIHFIVRQSRIKEDSALGIILSVFFGFGIVLLTYIQHNLSGNQSGLDDFIFGQAASMVGQDVRLITTIAFILLLLTALFFKEFKLLTFDPHFAKGIGLPTGFLNSLLLTMIVAAVVIGLQAVGVILMAAMLITPAIAARYWTDQLNHMVIISGLIGGLSGVLGTFLSTTMPKLATGPLIIVAATIMFFISLVFAPKRGLFANLTRQWRLRNRTALEQVLIYSFEKNIISTEMLHTELGISKSLLNKSVKRLERSGLISVRHNEIMLTENGTETGYVLLLKQRMYEMYLMYEMELSDYQLKNQDDFHPNMIPNDLKQRLVELLKIHDRFPTSNLKSFHHRGGVHS